MANTNMTVDLDSSWINDVDANGKCSLDIVVDWILKGSNYDEFFGVLEGNARSSKELVTELNETLFSAGHAQRKLETIIEMIRFIGLKFIETREKLIHENKDPNQEHVQTIFKQYDRLLPFFKERGWSIYTGTPINYPTPQAKAAAQEEAATPVAKREVTVHKQDGWYNMTPARPSTSVHIAPKPSTPPNPVLRHVPDHNSRVPTNNNVARPPPPVHHPTSDIAPRPPLQQPPPPPQPINYNSSPPIRPPPQHYPPERPPPHYPPAHYPPAHPIAPKNVPPPPQPQPQPPTPCKRPSRSGKSHQDERPLFTYAPLRDVAEAQYAKRMRIEDRQFEVMKQKLEVIKCLKDAVPGTLYSDELEKLLKELEHYSKSLEKE